MEIFFAFIIDLLIGDTEHFPHPVRGIGHIISSLENFLQKSISHKRTAGMVLVCLVVSITYIAAKVLINTAGIIHPGAGAVVSSVIIYFTLSIKGLYDESIGVYNELMRKDIDRARERLARIVGRDTESLSKPEIIRGSVECVAESIVDGIISPLFFAFIGGAPLALAYKAVNTLDSMVGYTNEQYLEFGWAAAKLDDMANYIPARIAGLLIPAAAFFCKKNWAYSLLAVINDGRKHPSPNSGLPEAGMAGALEVRLGGENYYQGVRFNRSYIGVPYRNLTVENICDANQIMFVTSILTLVLAISF